jgi:hypothetical protein
MSQLNCRTLTVHDYNEVEALISGRSTFVGVPKDAIPRVQAIQQATRLELKNLLQQPASVCMVFGAWIESKLVGAIVTFQSPSQACWFLRTAYVAPQSQHDVIATLLDHATLTYEGLGFKRFLAMYTEQSHARYTRLNHRTSVMDRYVGNTELVVESNVRPKFLDYWEYLYGRMLFPERTVVRSFNLVDDTMSTFSSIREAK